MKHIIYCILFLSVMSQSCMEAILHACASPAAKNSARSLKNFQRRIGYTFQNPNLLEVALTPPNTKGTSEHARLELCGDALLNLGLTEHLEDLKPTWGVHEIAQARSALACNCVLAELAVVLKMQKLLIGERPLAVHTLCDSMEALIGAIRSDSGDDTYKDFIRKFFLPMLASNPERTLSPHDSFGLWLCANACIKSRTKVTTTQATLTISCKQSVSLPDTINISFSEPHGSDRKFKGFAMFYLYFDALRYLGDEYINSCLQRPLTLEYFPKA